MKPVNYQIRVAPFAGGTIYLLLFPYGYRIQTHIFKTAGYITDRVFPLESETAAIRFYREECKKYGKEPNI